MLIQKVSRTLAEKIFLICQNGTGATINLGMGARFLGNGIAGEMVSADGVQVMALETGTTGLAGMASFSGIADQDIASLGYGRVQAWGFVNSVMLSGSTTSVTVGPDTLLKSFLQPGAIAGTWASALVVAINVLTTNTSPLQSWSKYITIMGASTGLSQYTSVYTTAFVRAL